jgi:hypothetical protein
LNFNKRFSAEVKRLISLRGSGQGSEELPLMRVLLWSYVAEITIQISGWANPGFARIKDSVHDAR